MLLFNRSLRIVVLLPGAALLLASCEGGWMKEDETNYMTQCRTSSTGMYADGARTDRYCQCSLDSLKAIYPVFNDIGRNKDTARRQAALLHCSELAQQ